MPPTRICRGRGLEFGSEVRYAYQPPEAASTGRTRVKHSAVHSFYFSAAILPTGVNRPARASDKHPLEPASRLHLEYAEDED